MAENLVGRRVGFLTVLEKTLVNHRGRLSQQCLCVCGHKVNVRVDSLQAKKTQSCGCKKGKLMSRTYRQRHGLRRENKLYQRWKSIKARCFSPNNQAFRWYGARGITLHVAWINNFDAFRSYIEINLGARPSSEYSLDRIDNNGNYEPGNLRWATAEQQAHNTRRNKLVTYQGKTQPLCLWLKELDLPRSLIRKRLMLGWSPEKAFELLSGKAVRLLSPASSHMSSEKSPPDLCLTLQL